MTTRGAIPLAGAVLAGMLTWLALQGEEQLAAVVVLGFLTLCGLVLLARGRSPTQRPIGLFLLAFGIRAIAAVAVYQGGLVNVLGDEDASVWLWGWSQSEVWRGHLPHAGPLPPSLLGAFGPENRGYIYLVALLFYPLGIQSRLAVAFMNAFFGGLTVVLVFMTAERLFDGEVARIAGLLAAFFPSLIIWSAQTLKEPVVIFCECLILYAVIRLREDLTLRHLAYALLGVLLVSTMRFYVAYLSLGVLGVTLLTPRLGVSNRSFVAGLLVLAVAIPVLKALGFLGGTSEHLRYFDLQTVAQYRAGASTGPGAGSTVQTDVDVRTPAGAAAATVVGVAHLLMAPFPWELGRASVRMLLTLPELLIWWWLLFRGVFPGLRHALRTRFAEIRPMLLFILPLNLIYGLMFTNIGLVFRQRAQLLPFYLIFAALGLTWRRRQRAERWIEEMRAHEVTSNRWRLRVRNPIGAGHPPREDPAAGVRGAPAAIRSSAAGFSSPQAPDVGGVR